MKKFGLVILVLGIIGLMILFANALSRFDDALYATMTVVYRK